MVHRDSRQDAREVADRRNAHRDAAVENAEIPLSADEVWDVLVEHCGATEAMREEFCYHFATTPEFRFMGSLGFGGKVYDPATRPRVGYYREDETPERRAAAMKANAVLTPTWAPGSRPQSGSSEEEA